MSIKNSVNLQIIFQFLAGFLLLNFKNAHQFLQASNRLPLRQFKGPLVINIRC